MKCFKQIVSNFSSSKILRNIEPLSNYQKGCLKCVARAKIPDLG